MQAAVEYCLFWQQWLCMPRSDWASWVQAVGTLAAIAATATVAICARRRERNEVRARAEIAGTEVFGRLEDLLGMCTVLRDLQLVGASQDVARRGARTAKGALLATEAELLAIAAHDPECARALSYGGNWVRQGAKWLEIVGNGQARTDADIAKDQEEIRWAFFAAHMQLQKAHTILRSSIPGEGGD